MIASRALVLLVTGACGVIPPGIWTAADVVEMSDCGYEEAYGRCICEQFVMYLSGDLIF